MMLLLAGIGLHHRSINRKTLAADQAFVHATLQNLFKDKAERLRIPEPAMSVLREGRVMRHLVGDL
jgi:DNA-binding Xre family transcriptional regulator